jgi:hypothetical protein
MVISPLLRGLFGLQTDAATHSITLAPHLPADWSFFSIHNVRAGDITLDFKFHRTADEIILSIDSSEAATLDFSPAVSLRAKVIDADLNGKRVSFQNVKNEFDQHLSVRTPLPSGKSTLRIRLHNDFGISYASSLPMLGNRSEGLRVTSESWSADALTMNAEGIAGLQYELAILNPEQITSVEGAEVRNGRLIVRIPVSQGEGYVPQKVGIHFAVR